MKSTPAHEPHAVNREAPKVPIFKTWRGVYLFVFGCFVAYVVALAAFTLVYS